MWDISKKNLISTHNGHQKEIYSLDISLNGRLAVSGSGDGTAKVWDLAAQRELMVGIRVDDLIIISSCVYASRF